jgi:hypothetical protein
VVRGDRDFAHPVRQELLGLGADPAHPGMRPHPIMAILVADALRDGLLS